jgi:hypothetical protein
LVYITNIIVIKLSLLFHVSYVKIDQQLSRMLMSELNESPAAELFETACKDILSTRRISITGDRILIPSDPGYANRRPLTLHASQFVSLVAGGNHALGAKLRGLITKKHMDHINPADALLTEKELEQVCKNLKASPEETERLQKAHDNTITHTTSATTPEQQDLVIRHILQPYHNDRSSTDERSEEAHGCKDLKTILAVRSMSVKNASIYSNWQTLINPSHSKEARGVSFDQIAAAANIQGMEGIAALKNSILLERILPLKLSGTSAKSKFARLNERREDPTITGRG